jgi:hypothetical protein
LSLPPESWPPHVVRFARAADGVVLCFPPLRAWRLAFRLALFGVCMLLPALIAASAFAPHGGASVLLGFVLTATFVYPLIAFGIVFLFAALSAVSTSLTVTASREGVRVLRHVLGIRMSDRALPRDAIAVIRQEAQNVPRLFGGTAYFRIVALAVPNASNRPYTVKRLVLADGIGDEALAESIEALLAESAGITRSTASRDPNEASAEN